MKAPNGKPSNLTPEQYKLVRTPAFKKWFGDWENSPETSSKVVDENGEPLVVYHSSNKRFTKFDYELSYDGAIWFTENLQKLKDNEAGASGSGIIYKVFLNIRKIGDWDDYDEGISYLLNEEFNGAKMDDDYIVFEPNQIKLADGTNTTFDANNPDIRYEDGGALNDEKYKLFREEFFTHLIAGKLGNIKGFSEKNGNKDINDLAIEISLLNQQHKAYEKGRDIIGKLYLLAKKIDENTGLKTSKGITYNYIIKRDIFSIKELYDKIDEEALPLFNELADESNTTFDANNPDIRYSKGGGLKDELAIVIKGVTNENKYKGNYKKIFDLIEKDIVFYSPYGTTSEELKGNDFYITIMPRPESSIIDEISKLKNVEIQNYFKLGGQIKYFEYTIGGL